MARLIALATDFGSQGIYTGQMHAVLLASNPDIAVVDLVNDLPAFQPQLGAYLLASMVPFLPQDALYVCVVDPGVGSDRAALILKADGRWLVGPDNGILAVVARRAGACLWWRITWKPVKLSHSFHGRDLFAPVAAMLARDDPVPGEPIAAEQVIGTNWPGDLAKIVYVDHFGNLITGLRSESLSDRQVVRLNGRSIPFARTFSDVPPGSAFWYANSIGLVEIAVNQGRAEQMFKLRPGEEVGIPAR